MNNMTNLEKAKYYKAQMSMCQEFDAIVPKDYESLMYNNYLEACSDMAGDLMDSKGLSASDAYRAVEEAIVKSMIADVAAA